MKDYDNVSKFAGIITETESPGIYRILKGVHNLIMDQEPLTEMGEDRDWSALEQEPLETPMLKETTAGVRKQE